MLLGISKPTAIGHLHCFWWWSLDYSDDGSLDGHDPIDIAIGAEWDGDPDAFLDAMIRVRFIDRDDNGRISVHDWDQYGGKLTRSRKSHAEYMRKQREAKGKRTGDSREPNVSLTDTSRAQLHNTTQEESTETDDKGTSSPGYSDDFLTFWKAFPKGKGNKKKSWEQWKRLKPDADLQATILDRVEAWKGTRQWQQGYVTHAERWLRDLGWDDDLPDDPPARLESIQGGNTPPIPSNVHNLPDPPAELFGTARRKWLEAKFIEMYPDEAKRQGLVAS